MIEPECAMLLARLPVLADVGPKEVAFPNYNVTNMFANNLKSFMYPFYEFKKKNNSKWNMFEKPITILINVMANGWWISFRIIKVICCQCSKISMDD